jgi:16S rRNA (guanine(1405)-N(7))-methyltransferase
MGKTIGAADPVCEIVASLASSRKYAGLCPDTLYRTAHWAWERYPDLPIAIRAARRKLHQVFASFIREDNIRKALRLVEDIPPCPGQDEMRPICRSIMELHASTRERMGGIERLYPALFAAVGGPPRRIADLACGLHPFAIPWMGLPPNAAYTAFDIDLRIVDALNRFFERSGFSAVAECRDLLADSSRVSADLVFLMKALPGLEQQEKGGAARVLGRLDAEWVIVSTPTASLSGRDKGMREHYDAMASRLVEQMGWQAQEMIFGNETFYILRTTS